MWSGERARFECVSEGRRRSALRAGRIFDTPPLGRALQSAFSAMGLLLDLEGFEKSAALSGAAGLPE